MTRCGTALAALMAAPGLATAAPATPEEAQRLTTLFERYVGHPADGPGAVAVTPEGESYLLSLDLGRLAAPLKAAGAVVTAGPLTAHLSPQPDGRWRVTMDGLPAIGVVIDNQSSSFSVNGYKLDGLFDPTLQAFASATTEMLGTTSRSAGPNGSSDVHVSHQLKGMSGATDNGDGTIDVTSHQASDTLTYDIAMTPAPPAAPAAPFGVRATGDALSGGYTLGHARNIAFNELWAFLVAHPSKESLIASQTDLKVRLKAVLPLVASATGDAALAKLVAETPQGTVTADAFSERFAFGTGEAKDGMLFALKASGLGLPVKLLPPWSAPLVPVGFDLAVKVDPIDVTPTLTRAVDEMDLAAAKPLTDEQSAALLAGLTERPITIRMPPGTLSTKLMTVGIEGEVTMAGVVPSGAATVTITGLDRTIDAVRAAAAGDPQAGQAVTLLSGLKIMGKAQGPDSYLWRVEALPGQDITVNGAPMSTPPSATAKPPKRKKGTASP